MTKGKLKWQTTSDGKHKVRVGDGKEVPQELVDHLGREFERECGWITKAARKVKPNAGK